MPVSYDRNVAPRWRLVSQGAGYVTRAARIWDPPRVIGMGYVRKEAEASGTALQWAGGTATVIHLPERHLPEGLKG